MHREAGRGTGIEVCSELALPDPAAEFRVSEVWECQARGVLTEIGPQIERATASSRVGPAKPRNIVSPVSIDLQGEVLVIELGQIEYVTTGIGCQRQTIT